MHALGHQATEAFTEVMYAEKALAVQSVFAAGVEKHRKLHCRAAEKETPCELGIGTSGVSAENC